MSGTHPPVVYKGRSLGLVVLVVAQLIIGSIHAVSGLWLLVASDIASVFNASSIAVYSVYTILFGLLTLVFAVGLWLRLSWGWVGTVAVGCFVAAADSLTLLNLPSVPGIPKLACIFEISYSLLIIAYLLQTHVGMKKQTAATKVGS